MIRRLLSGLLALAGLAFLTLPGDRQVRAADTAGVQWIWFDEGNPLVEAPAETRYFRRVFSVTRPLDEATLDITADNAFTVWMNGEKVGSGDDWKRVARFDVKKYFRNGDNVIAVEARNEGAAAGLIVRLAYIPNGDTVRTLASDGAWKASKTAGPGWQKRDYKDETWQSAKVLGPYGKVGPWKDIVWGVKGGTGRFIVPEGFRVEQAVKTPDDDRTFSLVNMTFDNRGRLLVSRENQGTFLCTNPDTDSVLQTVKLYCDQVKNAQGMCWVKDALLLIGTGPDGVGLYRCKEAESGDRIESVKLLLRYKGAMGEHGPHAVIHGPDGFLYLCNGNHSWARPKELAANSPLTRWPDGQMGPDQGKPHSTEDVLLPRLNDARGHAANILAPGGTIWRCDTDAKNMSLVSAGFRNHFDIAINPEGELFTFDSDMEWDENQPWYRPVRVCHCPPGADFVWRTGAANTPNYYVDSLPPIYETGRGSPVGLEFYNHHAFPEKYRGAYFLGDWSLGLIWAVHLQRQGASYKAEVEKFCQGAPMPVTDLAVSPDGAIVFTTGGRNSQGGVFRIVAEKKGSPDPSRPDQPLAAWSEIRRKNPDAGPEQLLATGKLPAEKTARDIYIRGLKGGADNEKVLLAALDDYDPFVRRRACEALIRAGIEPPVDPIWRLLSDGDRFVRTAARLVLQRIDPGKWADRIAHEKHDRVAWEAIIALCKVDKADPYASVIFFRLDTAKAADGERLLEYLRTVQMALMHTSASPSMSRTIAARCLARFPHAEWQVNRELAILLTHFRLNGQLGDAVVSKLLNALLLSGSDRMQQIHYFYCLRLVHNGWNAADKKNLAAWYEGTETWNGGHSFTPFLENIFRECLAAYDLADRKAILANAEQQPLVALVLAQQLQRDLQPELLPELKAVATRIGDGKALFRGDQLRQEIADALVKTALRDTSPKSFPYLVQGLTTTNRLLLPDVVEALQKVAARPAKEDPAPFRLALLAANQLDAGNRWQVVKLLRHWADGRQFGAEDGDWKQELGAWSQWFAQAFPKEAPLPNVTGDKPIESKYKYTDLLVFLERGDGRSGDAARGRAVFEKAQCMKCHKYGKDGEGVGPDLSTVSKRFKRGDVLESIVYPSKVISDQYRSTTIMTKKGRQVTGLAAVQGDDVTVLLSDGSKITLKKDEIEQQFMSLVSVMPEKLLDPLQLRDIADLFAYLESEPTK
jgi:putative heme-binding domain-containing protein